MIRKSIKMAIKRLMSFKAYSFINIGGLAIAISVCMAILLFAFHHFSFDRQIPNFKNSYRIISRYGEGSYSAFTFACFDKVLQNSPDVGSFTTNYYNETIGDIFVGDSKFEINESIFANSSFLDFFGIEMIQGSKESINQPNTVLLTSTIADRLFPNHDAIGQTVLMRSFSRNRDSLIAYTISGIVHAFPETSHIKFEILLSQKGHFAPTTEFLKSNKRFGALIYLKLSPSTDIKTLEQSLGEKAEPFLGGKHGPPLDVFNHKFQPISDIHFTQGLNSEMQPTIRRSSLMILLLVGFLIFVIAVVNFVIMRIARTAYYSKSNLIIRFLGGSKFQFFVQTFIEVLLSVTGSFLLMIFLLTTIKLSIARHFFSNWIISLQSASFWTISGAFFIVAVGIISLLSSINLLKRNTDQNSNIQHKGIKTAIPLVVFQLILVVGLISFAIVINKQMNFVESKELGFSSENVMIIHVPQQNATINVFRSDLLTIPGIIDAGTAHHYPGFRLQDMTFSNGDNAFPFKFGYLDHDALRALNIETLKHFKDTKSEASGGWVINETFYNVLRSKYSEEQIATGNFPRETAASEDNNMINFEILGVIRDFNYASLHTKIESFAFYIAAPGKRNNRFLLVRFNQSKLNTVIPAMEKIHESLYPGKTVKYSFLDEQLAQQYASEQTMLKLINLFSILVIIVACLGLTGLSIFISEKRTKEIGIRKVNGATIFEIVNMLNLDFVKWVGIAFVVATPIAYYATQKWLENFAYKTDLNWWIFALAGLFALVIAITTVSWSTFRAARRNPVVALRYE